MKLVDILARELEEWPAECTSQRCCQSDFDTEVFFGGLAKSIRLSRRASRTYGVSVTRAEWQAAVDALKGWNGEGLPPVGAKVRIGAFPGNKWLENFQGREAVIIAHDVTKSGEESAVFKTFANNGYPRYHALAYEEGNFLPIRPIRTAEQIAAEERALGVKQIADHLFKFTAESGRRAIAECLYDAGYRKRVQP